MSRAALGIGILAWGLAAGPALAGGEGSDGLAVPLVAVAAGRSVPAEAPDAVAAGIAAPTLRRDALRRRLSLASPDAAAGEEDPVARGARAADLFFAGDHEAARLELEGLLAAVEGRPGRLAREPRLRPAAFDARMFLAMIARLRGDEELVDGLLAGARRRYPELEPGSADFPPWLRERHAAAVLPVPGEAVAVELPEGCALVADGREIPAGEGLDTGFARAVQARCGDRTGPVVLVPEGAAAVRPLALRSAALAGEGGEVVLAADAGADDGALIRDLLELARAAGAARLVAAVGRIDGIELWLVDAGTGKRVRTAVVAGLPDGAGELERAGAALAGIGADGGGPSRPWYRDGTAWAVAATGLAAVVTGIALGRAYGGPSEQEPAAVALMASGAALAATGVVLFLVPAPREDGGVALSAGAAIAF